MVSRFHFVSGLPRSGSTLLAGILKQNPRFHAAMSSPLSTLMQSNLELMGAGHEFYSFFDEPRRKTIIHSLFSAYYQQQLRQHDLIFDTSRNWTAHLHQLVELFDDFKVICCVRNPAWIADSFECIYRRNPFDYSRMFSAANRQTVYSRCEALMNAAGTIGSAWTALKEAYYSEYSELLLLVDYELLTRHPKRTIELIYEFINEPFFEHDFDNVEYEEGEFDQQLGVKGLHSVRKKVTFSSRRTILPPELYVKYQQMDFWQDNNGTSAHIIACQKSSTQGEQND